MCCSIDSKFLSDHSQNLLGGVLFIIELGALKGVWFEGDHFFGVIDFESADDETPRNADAA